MSKPRSDGDRTRERILEVALPLFAQHGFAGTSVRTVGAAAGVNVATLAYHFQDKQGLYDAVVQRLHEDLASNLAVRVAQGTSASEPRELLRSWLREAWRFSDEHREHQRLLLRHVLDHGRRPEVIEARWSDPLMERASALVGMLRPDMPEHERRLLVVTLMHLTVRLVLEDRRQLAHMAGLAEEGIDERIVDWLTTLTAPQLGLQQI
ncbi:MAG: TetR/AcrR family transcriptional regulator [Alphaproteobacteria bacterium]|nr:TetR/AcrR family transcriptional regulator [Alphaproteobacteria bacterium]MCB9695948.1 TetR/AcrR family transcriptional regulator [Alphaproteobacteria bacterium]